MKQIINQLTAFCSANGFDVRILESDEFECDVDMNIIYITTKPNKYDQRFVELCKEEYPELPTDDVFLLSFMHELGHIATVDEFTYKEWTHYERLKEKIKDDFDFYFYIENEFVATQWGCETLIQNWEVFESMLEWTPKVQ